MKKLVSTLLGLLLVLGLAACDTDNSPAPSAPPDSSTAQTDVPTPAPSDTLPEVSTPADSPTQSQPMGDKISKAEAKQIVLAHAKLSESDINHFEIELDANGKGLILYEIEFSAGTDRYDYYIRAVNGEILSAEKNDKSLLAETYKKIAESEAKTAALEHAGLKEADITNYKIEFDADDGVPSYEIEFRSGGFEYEYDVHSSDGKILKSEKEIAD